MKYKIKKKKAASGYTTIAQTADRKSILKRRQLYDNSAPENNVLDTLIGSLSGGVPSMIAAPALIGLSSIIQEGKYNAMMDAEVKRRNKQDRINQLQYNQDAYTANATYGSPGVTQYYKYGGTKKMAKGGTVSGKLGTNTQMIVGPKHENGGVDMGNNIEAEGGEVNYFNPHTGANTIFSDRLGLGDKSFADIAEVLSKKKGKLEELAKNPDELTRKTAKRNLQKNRVELDGLVAAQISKQLSKGINPDGEVTYASQGLTTLLPYVDNIVNMMLTKNTPELPEPRDLKALPFKTSYNVKPQLAEIDQQQAANVAALKDATSFGPQRRNAIIASSLSAIGQRSSVLAQKENVETELINRDVANRQQVLNANAQNEQQYDMLNFQRLNEIQGRISANFANLAEDAQIQISEDRLRQRDAAEIALLKERYNRDGIFDRNIDKAFEDYLSGKITYSEFQKQLANRTAANTGGATVAAKNRPSGQKPISSLTRGASTNQPSTEQYQVMLDKYVLPYVRQLLSIKGN